MDGRTTPQQVERQGISKLSTEEVVSYARSGKTVMLVSRGERSSQGVRLQVRPEILPLTDLLSTVKGTSNLVLLDTDLMGTLGVIELNPGVDQTAYGIFADLVDIACSVY